MKRMIGTLVAAVGLSCALTALGQQTTVPHTFEAGTPARASEVNDNFSALVDSINRNQAAIEAIPEGPPGPEGPEGPQGPSGARLALVAVVAKSGGDYTSPLDAVANIAAGDAWCRDEVAISHTSDACVIKVEPGVYELAETLVVPAFVSVVGSGPKATTLSAGPGVQIAVRLGVQGQGPGGLGGLSPGHKIVLRDVSVQNLFGDGSTSIAVAALGDSFLIPRFPESDVEVLNVNAYATGSSENIGVWEEDLAQNTYRFLEASATGGTTSIGFDVGDSSRPKLEHCRILASDATVSNTGLSHRGGQEKGGYAQIENCVITATGGQTAFGVLSSQQTASIAISRSTIRAYSASLTNVGMRAGGLDNHSELFNVEIETGGAASTAISIWLGAPWDHVRIPVMPAGDSGPRRPRFRSMPGRCDAVDELS
ncbi:MAG: hypothetical protein OEM78_17155, partial [Gammaproteobacteria bacterium]|nr:hypothetical protein [Gammaproteobacteria bacterium]